MSVAADLTDRGSTRTDRFLQPCREEGRSVGARLVKPFLITPEKGARTSLFLATTADPAPFHGGYVVGRKLKRPDPAALDDDLAERLWSASARLVGL